MHSQTEQIQSGQDQYHAQESSTPPEATRATTPEELTEALQAAAKRVGEKLARAKALGIPLHEVK